MEEKKKFNWMEFFAVLALVAITALATFGVTWYFMDAQSSAELSAKDAEIISAQNEINALNKKVTAAEDIATKADAKPVTQAMIESGSYTLGTDKVTLVAGKATVGVNTYALDTKNIAFNTDKTSAVIVINETTGTPAAAVKTYVVSVSNKDGKANQNAAVALSSDTTVTSVSYGTNDKITVKTTTTTSTSIITKTYVVSGTNLVESTN